jgi:hypothetical protein
MGQDVGAIHESGLRGEDHRQSGEPSDQEGTGTEDEDRTRGRAGGFLEEMTSCESEGIAQSLLPGFA